MLDFYLFLEIAKNELYFLFRQTNNPHLPVFKALMYLRPLNRSVWTVNVSPLIDQNFTLKTNASLHLPVFSVGSGFYEESGFLSQPR